jgi:1,5-anhydro-D-fructose reductase (1,5-anhydro-D-mannitol-forming)
MRWGLIGTSGYGRSVAAPAIAAVDGAELIAVLSSDGDRAGALAGEHGAGHATTDPKAFLGTPELEAVWITAPTFMHHDLGLAALSAGKHVLLEKPLAMTSAQGWELVEAARRANLVLATGYQARYVPAHRTMRRLIAEGAIGEVSMVRTYYGVHRGGPPPEWRQHRDTAHWGALADIGTHHLDLLRMLIGEVSEATAVSGHQLGFETEDTSSAALRFESGALGSLTVSVNVWKQHTRVEVHGTRGALVAVDTSPTGQGSAVLITGDGERDITGERPNSQQAQLAAVDDAASGGESEYATGEDGARNLEILEQILP